MASAAVRPCEGRTLEIPDDIFARRSISPYEIRIAIAIEVRRIGTEIGRSRGDDDRQCFGGGGSETIGGGKGQGFRSTEGEIALVFETCGVE